MYAAKLSTSRSGLNMSADEYFKLDATIKNGIDNNLLLDV